MTTTYATTLGVANSRGIPECL